MAGIDGIAVRGPLHDPQISAEIFRYSSSREAIRDGDQMLIVASCAFRDGNTFQNRLSALSACPTGCRLVIQSRSLDLTRTGGPGCHEVTSPVRVRILE